MGGKNLCTTLHQSEESGHVLRAIGVLTGCRYCVAELAGLTWKPARPSGCDEQICLGWSRNMGEIGYRWMTEDEMAKVAEIDRS